MNRDEAVAAITEGAGKTPEQAQAFLDILGSAFRRRGWVEGEPLDQDAIAERLDTFVRPAVSGEQAQPDGKAQR